MAGLGIKLDAQQCRQAFGRQVLDDPTEIDSVQDLPKVAVAVLGSELEAGPLPDALPRVFFVLQVAQVGGRGELLVVLVLDASISESVLELERVGPGVLRPAHATTLAHVEDDSRVCLVESSKKSVERPAVDTDRGDVHRRATRSVHSVAAEAECAELEELARDVERFLAERSDLVVK